MTGRDAIAAIADEAAALERELAEIDLLIGQAQTEAARHEGKRVQASDKLTTLGSRPEPPGAELLELSNQVLTLTKRAAMMEAQVDVLEGKRKALTRFRDSLVRHADVLKGEPGSDGFDELETHSPASPIDTLEDVAD